MKKIKYIGFYSNNDENRNSVLSATNKMDYIAEALEENVEIISPSWTYNKKNYKMSKKKLTNKIELILGPTISWGSKINKIFSIIFSNCWLFLYLASNIKKDESVIVYHSIWLLIPIYLLKKIRKFKLILEVEEIYHNVSKVNLFIKIMEEKVLRSADKYIFSTELLNDKLNKEKKPYVVIYGTYKVEEKHTEKFSDGRIHLVYAGTLDPRKGCLTAVSLGEYLNENYHIHILGFGKPFEVSQLLEQIRNVSTKTNCKITYEGILKGKEYIKFLQQCQIGLSPQSLNEEYNETSFPSKVLSYLANGLRVFSVKIKSLEKSSISNILYFYETTNIEEIANEIKKIKIQDKYDSRNIIEILDQKFRKDIKKMMVNTNE